MNAQIGTTVASIPTGQVGPVECDGTEYLAQCDFADVGKDKMVAIWDKGENEKFYIICAEV